MISFYLIILTSFLMLFYKNTFQLKPYVAPSPEVLKEYIQDEL